MKQFIYFSICLFFTFISCDNNSFEEFGDNDEIVSDDVVSFIYKSKFYSSVIDENAIEIFDTLQLNPTLATLISDTLMFFDNYDQMESYCISKIEKRSKKTKATPSSSWYPDVTEGWHIKMFTAKNFGGNLEEYKGNGNYSLNIIKYNNQISSLQVGFRSTPPRYCYITFYENGHAGNDGGRSLRFELFNDRGLQQFNPGVGESILNLRYIPRASGGRNWNDKISSLKVEIKNQ